MHPAPLPGRFVPVIATLLERVSDQDARLESMSLTVIHSTQCMDA